MAESAVSRPPSWPDTSPNGSIGTIRQVDRATTRTVREELASGTPDIGLIWELCLRFEYERGALVNGLADWLGPPAGLRVLDGACGSGFPALELIQRGYAVTCSDGSPEMLGDFGATRPGRRLPYGPSATGGTSCRRALPRRSTWCCAGAAR